MYCTLPQSNKDTGTRSLSLVRVMETGRGEREGVVHVCTLSDLDASNKDASKSNAVTALNASNVISEAASTGGLTESSSELVRTLSAPLQRPMPAGHLRTEQSTDNCKVGSASARDPDDSSSLPPLLPANGSSSSSNEDDTPASKRRKGFLSSEERFGQAISSDMLRQVSSPPADLSTQSEMGPKSTPPSTNRYTMANNAWALRNFRDWLSWRRQVHPDDPVDEDILYTNVPAQISKWFSLFMLETRRKDGTKFPASSMNSLVCALQRLRRERDPLALSILDDRHPGLAEFRTVRDAVSLTAEQEGLGGVKRFGKGITADEEEKLWASGVLGLSSPVSLLNAVFFLTGKIIGIRGGHEHRQLKLSQFQVYEDKVVFSQQDPNDARKNKSLEHHANPSAGQRCYVNVMKTYISRLPESARQSDSFYYRPKVMLPSNPEEPWFADQPIGRNRLTSFVKDVCSSVGITGKNNHSLRGYSGPLSPTGDGGTEAQATGQPSVPVQSHPPKESTSTEQQKVVGFPLQTAVPTQQQVVSSRQATVPSGQSIALSGPTAASLEQNSVSSQQTPVSPGQIALSSGQIGLPSGQTILPQGQVGLSSRQITLPSGQVGLPSGQIALPSGQIALPSGQIALPSGQIALPSGQIALPSGQIGLPSGQIGLPPGQIAVPTPSVGTLPAVDDDDPIVLVPVQHFTVYQQCRKSQLK